MLRRFYGLHEPPTLGPKSLRHGWHFSGVQKVPALMNRRNWLQLLGNPNLHYSLSGRHMCVRGQIFAAYLGATEPLPSIIYFIYFYCFPVFSPTFPNFFSTLVLCPGQSFFGQIEKFIAESDREPHLPRAWRNRKMKLKLKPILPPDQTSTSETKAKK